METRRILYADEYSPPVRGIVSLLTRGGFKVDSSPTPQAAEQFFLEKHLTDYYALVANLNLVYESEILIKAHNPDLKLVLLTQSSEGHESVNREGKTLRCGYNTPRMILDFLKGDLDVSQLPGNRERQFHSVEHYL